MILGVADQRMLALGVRDPEAHHPHGHLHHLVGVRVIHEGAGPARDEFVDIGLARWDAGLVQAGHAVHAVGQALAMPVDAGQLAELVGDEEAHTVAFDHFDGRARALAVVAPQVRLESGRHLAHHGLGHQVELLDPLVHAPRQGPAVQRDHGVVGPARVGYQRRHGVRLVLHHRLGQGGHGHLADGGHRGGCSDRTGTAQERATIEKHVSSLGRLQ
jgi:hypothetical protein